MCIFILQAQNVQATHTTSILCNLLTPTREGRIPVITQILQNVQGYHSSEFMPIVTLLPGKRRMFLRLSNN